MRESSNRIFKAYKEKVIKLNSRSSVIKCSDSTLKKTVIDITLLSEQEQQNWIDWLVDDDCINKNIPFYINYESFDTTLSEKIEDLNLELEQSTIMDDLAVTDGCGMLLLDETKKNLDDYKRDLMLNFDKTEEEADIEVDAKLTALIDKNKTRDYILQTLNETVKQKEKMEKQKLGRFTYLDKRATDIQKQSGTYTLYAGYKFITGQIDKTTVNAPLILIPITIKQSKNRIEIYHNSNRMIILNRPLIIMLEALAGLKIKQDINLKEFLHSDTIADKLFDDSSKINELSDCIGRIYLRCKGNLYFTIYKASCLGIFNVSTSIYDDYTLLETLEPNELIDKTLHGDKTNSEKILNTKNKAVDYKTEELNLISPLDSSQELAVYMSGKDNNLVIYGPPGTGKSQVITNIIANALSKNQKILLVSEKKTALEVVHNRLGRLNKYCMMLSDSNDNTEFRRKVKDTQQNFNTEYVDKQSNRLEISKSIDNDLNKLNELHNYLTDNIDNVNTNLSELFKDNRLTHESEQLATDFYINHRDVVNMEYSTLLNKLNTLSKEQIEHMYLSDLALSKWLLSKSLMDIKICINDIYKYNTAITYLNNNDTQTIISMIDMETQRLSVLNKIYSELHIDNKFIIPDQTNTDYIPDKLTIAELSDIYKRICIYKAFVENKKSVEELTKLGSLEDKLEIVYKQQYYKEIKQLNEVSEILTNMHDKIQGIPDIFMVDVPDNEIELSNKQINYNIAIMETLLLKVENILKKFNAIGSDTKFNEYLGIIENELKNSYADTLDILDRLIVEFQDEEATKIVIDNSMNFSDVALVVNNTNTFRFRPKKLFSDYTAENKVNFIKLVTARKLVQDRLKQELNYFNSEINYIIKSIEQLQLKYSNILSLSNIRENMFYIEEYVKLKKESMEEHLDIKKDQLHIAMFSILSEIKDSDIPAENLNHICVTLHCNKDNIKYTIENLINNSNKIINNYKNQLQHLETYTSIRDSFRDSELGQFEDDIKYIDLIDANLEELLKLSQLNEEDKQIIKLLNIYSKDDILDGYITANIYKNKVVSSDALMRVYESLVSGVIQKEKDKTLINLDCVEHATNDKIIYDICTQGSNLLDLDRELSKKRNVKYIREIVKDHLQLLMSMYPVWMLTPEVVSDVLPLEKNMFDMIIFDEASQMFIEKAIPSMYRAKKAIVAGDDKQLKPSSFFDSNYLTDEAEDILDETTGKDASLLDQAKLSFNSVNLMFHYRAKYSELIQYSNYAFYNSLLKISPNIEKLNNDNKVIDYRNVQGIHDADGTNLREAEEVVSIVKEILLGNNTYTIGIVTLNSKQRDLIDDLLDVKAAEDKDKRFCALLKQERNRIENDEDISLFVKSIEDVQGDERDIIIFSIDRGYDKHGKLHTFLGPIAQIGGENRLNVAISRAKCKEYVITSIEPEVFNVTKSINVGPKLFKEFLQYARAVSNNSLSEINKTNIDIKEDKLVDIICKQLRDSGYTVDTNIGTYGYKIDIAIFNDKLNKYIACVELDNDRYCSNKSVRDRDISRRRFLESRGWNMIHVWSKDWWENPDKAFNNLIKQLEVLNNQCEETENIPCGRVLNKTVIETNVNILEQKDSTGEESEFNYYDDRLERYKNCNIIDIDKVTENDIIGYRVKALIVYGTLVEGIRDYSDIVKQCIILCKNKYNLEWVKKHLGHIVNSDKTKFKRAVSVSRGMYIEKQSSTTSLDVSKEVLDIASIDAINIQLIIDNTLLSSKSLNSQEINPIQLTKLVTTVTNLEEQSYDYDF